MDDSGRLRRKIQRLWVGELTLDEVCEEMGMTEAELTAFASSIGLPPRGHVECYLPAPLEIVEACARYRHSWQPGEREVRRVGKID